MKQQDIDSQYADLISSYLSGNANSQEVAALEQWVLADPDNRRQFMAAKKAWMLAGMAQQQPVEVEALWEQTAQQLEMRQKEAAIKPLWRRSWMRMAAAIVLLAALSFWIFQLIQPDAQLVAEATDAAKTVALPDGSQIILNQSSSIRYASGKEATERKVELEGDAFFEVARDEQHPFVIQTQALEIEVLGTAFYVDARQTQEEIQVIVESGRVAVRAGDVATILTANEKAVFQKNTQQLSKQQNEDSNFLSLKTNTLVFDNTPLTEVVFALNRQYHAQIVIQDDALKNCRLNASYQDKSLPAILTILESSFDLQAKPQGTEILLTGSCEAPTP